MGITIKVTPKKTDKAKSNITTQPKIRTKSAPADEVDVLEESEYEKQHKKKVKIQPVDFTKLFLDVNNTIRPYHAYVDSDGDLVMFGNIGTTRICLVETSEANLALEAAAWELRPDVPETDENKSTITRTRISIDSNMIDIAETTLGAWTAHVKNIAGINGILPSKRTYYSLATGEQLESGTGKGIDYKRRYMCKPQDKELAINKLKAIIKANPKAGKDIEWFI